MHSGHAQIYIVVEVEPNSVWYWYGLDSILREFRKLQLCTDLNCVTTHDFVHGNYAIRSGSLTHLRTDRDQAVSDGAVSNAHETST